MSERFALACLSRGPAGLRTIPAAAARVDLVEYSRFKYGDGAVSAVYGRQLAELMAPTLTHLDGPLVVTSSGFGFAAPAAHSLVAPFVAALADAGVRACTARVHRSSVSDGDYAAMSLEQRRAAMSSRALSVSAMPPGALVIAVDDVRVTGVHETAMDECLRAGGARDVMHSYIVDAWDVREDPATEALLNASGVTTDAQLLDLAHSERFLPNARFCKRVLGMPEPRMQRFLALGPSWLPVWIESVITGDSLDSVGALRGGCAVFRGMVVPAAAVA